MKLKRGVLLIIILGSGLRTIISVVMTNSCIESLWMEFGYHLLFVQQNPNHFNEWSFLTLRSLIHMKMISVPSRVKSFQKIDDVTQKMRWVVENGGSAFDIVESFNLGEGIAMKHSDFKIGDAVVRRWNNRVYYIIADVDNDKWEFVISDDVDAKFKYCKVCDMYSNLRYATQEEIRNGYAESF